MRHPHHPRILVLLASASLSTIILAGTAHADGTASSASSANSANATSLADSEIVVTGTRVANRSKLDTIAPVDVVTANELRQQGTPELATALANVIPSLDFPRPSGNDGSDSIRAAILRGLSPDETLVLIDGVRAHASAYLNVNSALGRGSAAVDLNTIPDVALESVEVLRDGASAQYGSDAIAGVVNLRLREADHGGSLSVSEGIYATDYTAAGSPSRSVTGEPVTNVSGWQGLKLGGDGFLTISGDYQHRSFTDRAGSDPRVGGAVDALYGDPKVDQYTGWANFGKPIDDNLKLYGWVGYQYRNSWGSEFPRLASAASGYGLADVYPDGFIPILNIHSYDLNSALGVKGDVNGWNVNAKVSYGRNVVTLNTLNSANYTLGAGTPTNFYDGKLTYGQFVGGFDASKSFDVFKSLNVAWGAEVRHENYKIGAGDLASYEIGTVYPSASPGAQGYPGLSPANVVDASRTAESLYLDLEAQATDKLRLGAAGRYEHYSDFGSTGTGKVSARYDFSPAFAIRATGSTGFRAPSLQQEYYTSVASVLNGGVVVPTGTYPSTSAVAQALGGKPLEPERAASATAGFVFRAGGLDMTVDGYYTHIRNGLALSESLSGSLVAGGLPDGASAARFFINGLGITVQGIDAVVHYKVPTRNAGSFDLTLSGNVNTSLVTNTPAVPLATGTSLFGRARIVSIEDGIPGEKVVAAVVWSKAQWGATARVTYYGNVTIPSTTGSGSAPANDYNSGSRAIADLEFRYQPKQLPFNLAVGANNLFDTYPRAVPAAYNNNGGVGFPYYSPFGFNGRFVYIRAGLHW